MAGSLEWTNGMLREGSKSLHIWFHKVWVAASLEEGVPKEWTDEMTVRLHESTESQTTATIPPPIVGLK